MDRFSSLFADYAKNVSFEKISSKVIHEVKRRIIDSVGVAVAAYSEQTPEIARKMGYDFRLSNGATVIGTPVKTTPGLAAFINGLHVRYLDFSDTYLSLEPIHPSDVIMPLLALAEYNKNNGKDLVTSIATAYEAAVSLCDSGSLRKNGWDHVNFIAIGVVLGASKLLNMNVQNTKNAIALTIVPHAAMRQTRAGELSMWKGAAAANASKNAIFSSLLAEKGFTGPNRPFEGEMGFNKLLLKDSIHMEGLKTISEKRPPERIMDTHIKFWPVEYHAQSAVEAAINLKENLNVEKIEELTIDTFDVSYEILAKDPEKWQPKTRETADHSLPYITLTALLDGKVTKESFSKERLNDKKTMNFLKNNVKLNSCKDLSRLYPDGIPNRIIVRTKDGKVFSEEVCYPKGHAKNPMTDSEVEEKFRSNVKNMIDKNRVDEVLDILWNIEKLENFKSLFNLLLME